VNIRSVLAASRLMLSLGRAWAHQQFLTTGPQGAKNAVTYAALNE
jgi:hypothetical protein